MNYKKLYKQLIANRQLHLLTENDGYRENHHILPKSMSGTNTHENMVYLTAREHYVAHKLLTKIYPEDNGMVCALFFMMNGQQRKYLNLTSKEYEIARKKSSKLLSIRRKGKKMNISDEERKRRSESMKGSKNPCYKIGSGNPASVPIMAFGKRYGCMIECAKEFGLSRKQIYTRVNSDRHPEYFRL